MTEHVTPLRRRMIDDMTIRNMSPNSQSAYIQQVSLFARHFGKSPTVLGPEDIRTYQLYLMNDKKLAASSVQIATAALRFLYKVTLKKGWSFKEIIPSPKAAAKLPIVLSPDEVLRFLSCVESVTRSRWPRTRARARPNSTIAATIRSRSMRSNGSCCRGGPLSTLLRAS